MTTRRVLLPPLIVTATLVLAGCGTSPPDRTVSGLGIGAATGAVIGALAGGIGAPLGTAIGAGVGATTGAVTTPQAVDLGTPIWRRADIFNLGSQATASTAPPPTGSSGSSEARSPARPSAAPASSAASSNRASAAIGTETVQQVQQELKQAGLYDGPIDGIVGPKTRRALEQYQRQAGLSPTGQLDRPTLAALINLDRAQAGGGGSRTGAGSSSQSGAGAGQTGSASGQSGGTEPPTNR